jgi:hypothetical protein
MKIFKVIQNSKMFKLFFFCFFFSIFSKLTIGAILQEVNFNSNDNTFNGTLTEDYLLQLGYTFKTTEIYLVNRNITSIAPYAFINFTKLDTISLTTNIEQINATAFKGINYQFSYFFFLIILFSKDFNLFRD